MNSNTSSFRERRVPLKRPPTCWFQEYGRPFCARGVSLAEPTSPAGRGEILSPAEHRAATTRLPQGRRVHKPRAPKRRRAAFSSDATPSTPAIGRALRDLQSTPAAPSRHTRPRRLRALECLRDRTVQCARRDHRRRHRAVAVVERCALVPSCRARSNPRRTDGRRRCARGRTR